MNGLSLRDLCCLFCCPPCPSRIASKLAFLPPEPTYSFGPPKLSSTDLVDSTTPTPILATVSASQLLTLRLSDRSDWQYTQPEFDMIDVFTVRSSRGNRVACLYVRAFANAKFTVLFSHGNAVDLGQMSSFYVGLATRINCNIFSYDYSGYGMSTGRPSEKNLYADIEAAWTAMKSRYGLSPESIILYGQSIGTVPTVHLAARYQSAAVVLHSPLMSGLRIVCPQNRRTCCLDVFPSIDKVPRIASPVLVIHGTEDEVIDFSHGLAIYERCQQALAPLWIEGAGHNDIELYSQYLDRLRRLINVDLAPKPPPPPASAADIL